MSFHSITEIENTCAVIEQVRDVLSLLQERYFDAPLADDTAKYLFAAGQGCMNNILSLIGTQLCDISNRLEEVASYELDAHRKQKHEVV